MIAVVGSLVCVCKKKEKRKKIRKKGLNYPLRLASGLVFSVDKSFDYSWRAREVFLNGSLVLTAVVKNLLQSTTFLFITTNHGKYNLTHFSSLSAGLTTHRRRSTAQTSRLYLDTSSLSSHQPIGKLRLINGLLNGHIHTMIARSYSV